MSLDGSPIKLNAMDTETEVKKRAGQELKMERKGGMPASTPAINKTKRKLHNKPTITKVEVSYNVNSCIQTLEEKPYEV